jgi:hypothetical protein
MAVTQPPLVPGAGPRPVRSSADVLAQFPWWIRLPTAAPLRDALVDALTGLLFSYQERAEVAAAQCDELRATREYLLSIGSDFGTVRQASEDEEAFRERMLGGSAVVTEVAITTAVNAILAPFTDVQCQFVDGVLDQYFIEGASSEWHAFFGATPQVLPRLYEADAALNEGLYRPNSDPTTARFFGQPITFGGQTYVDNFGCLFCLLVPNLTTTGGPFVGAPPISDPEGQMYVGGAPPSSTVQQSFHYGAGSAAESIYQAISNTVERIVGQSVRWTMIAEL